MNSWNNWVISMDEDFFTLSIGKRRHIILAKILSENEESTHIVIAMNTSNNHRVLVEKKTLYLVSKFNQANYIYKIFDESQVTVHTCLIYNFVISKKTCTFVDSLVNYMIHRRFPRNGNFLRFCKIETPVCAGYMYLSPESANGKPRKIQNRSARLHMDSTTQVLLPVADNTEATSNEAEVTVKQKIHDPSIYFYDNDRHTNVEDALINMQSIKKEDVTCTQPTTDTQETVSTENIVDELQNTSETEKIPETSWTIKSCNTLQEPPTEKERIIQPTDVRIQSNILSTNKAFLRANQNLLRSNSFETTIQLMDEIKTQLAQHYASDVSKVKPTIQCNSNTSSLSDETKQQISIPVTSSKQFTHSVSTLNEQEDGETKNTVSHDTQKVQTTTKPSFYFVQVPNVPTSEQENHCLIEISSTAEQTPKVLRFNTPNKSRTQNSTTDIEQNSCSPSTSNNEAELSSTQQKNQDAQLISYSAETSCNKHKEIQALKINERTTPLTDVNTTPLRKRLRKKSTRTKFKQAGKSGNQTHTLSSDNSVNRSTSKLIRRNKRNLTLNLFHHKSRVLHISGLTEVSEQNERNTLQYAFQVLNRCAKKAVFQEFEISVGSMHVPNTMQHEDENYLLFTDHSKNDNHITKINETERILPSEVNEDKLCLSIESKMDKHVTSIRKSKRSRKLRIQDLYEEYECPYQKTTRNYKRKYNKNKRITSSLNIFRSQERKRINMNETIDDTSNNEVKKLIDTECTMSNAEIKPCDKLLCKKYNIKNCNVILTRHRQID